jgi:hypothetical protein
MSPRLASPGASPLLLSKRTLGTRAAATGPEWRENVNNVPQLRGENLRNGQFWCGPAVGTTLARMLGASRDKPNYVLLHELADRYSTPGGSTPAQMVGMLRGVGGKVDGRILTGGYSNDELNGVFGRGGKVAAQIGLRDPKTGEYAAHWVVVSGRSANGGYTVRDPLRGEYTMTPDELRKAVTQAPGLGGVLIPVAPAEQGDRARPGRSSQDLFEDHCRADGGRGGRDPLSVPRGTSAQELASQLVDQLRNGGLAEKQAALRRLDALAHSSGGIAGRAFLLIMRLFGKQPGGGQKAGLSGNGGCD